MKKELSLGKVAYDGKTKSNEVSLELRIETKIHNTGNFKDSKWELEKQ